MAESSSFDVEEGDIILLGTDGLFDNMNEDMILDCLSKMKVQKNIVNLQFHADTCMDIIVRPPVKSCYWYLKNCKGIINVMIPSNPIIKIHVSHSVLDMRMFWAMHNNQIEYGNK